MYHRTVTGIILSDHAHAGRDGFNLLSTPMTGPRSAVILPDGRGDIPMAVTRRWRAGAFDYLEKPVRPPRC